MFAGLFAAIMSTADGFLNIGAAAIVHDIPKALRGRSIKRELLFARIATVAIALLAAAKVPQPNAPSRATRRAFS